VAHAAVVACVGADCCDGFDKFIAVNEPHHPVRDYVGAWLSELRLEQSPIATGKLRLAGSKRVGTINLKLMEGGYPTLSAATTSGEIWAPDPAAVDRATRHSMAHGYYMFDSVLSYLYNAHAICSRYRDAVPLRPAGPSGGLVGWTCGFMVELP
jgi:hypothetical protein